MKIVLIAAVLPFLLSCPVIVQAQTQAEEPTHPTTDVSFDISRSAGSLRDLSLAAARGDGSAARSIGGMYDTGQGVPQDQATALNWYRRAAMLGDVTALFDVAICYDAGTGTARDPVAAARWYARAATKHSGRAEYNLGLMYLQGDGVRRDPKAAARLFQAALEDGIAAARRQLGRLSPTLSAGAPADADADADTAFAVAQHALLEKTPAASVKAATVLTRVAARAGPVAGIAGYDLAWCYENGVGVGEDRRHAYDLFIRVAAETDDPALRILAQTGAEVSDRPPAASTASARPSANRRQAPGTPDGSPAASPD